MAPFLHWCFAALELEALAVPNPKVEILTNGTAFHDSRMLLVQTELISFSIYTHDGVERRSLHANLRGHSGSEKHQRHYVSPEGFTKSSRGYKTWMQSRAGGFGENLYVAENLSENMAERVNVSERVNFKLPQSEIRTPRRRCSGAQKLCVLLYFECHWCTAGNSQ